MEKEISTDHFGSLGHMVNQKCKPIQGLFGIRVLVEISVDNSLQTLNPHFSPIHIWC
jgi:hypothetical protein